jgi:hypothetical protein
LLSCLLSLYFSLSLGHSSRCNSAVVVALSSDEGWKCEDPAPSCGFYRLNRPWRHSRRLVGPSSTSVVPPTNGHGPRSRRGYVGDDGIH